LFLGHAFAGVLELDGDVSGPAVLPRRKHA